MSLPLQRPARLILLTAALLTSASAAHALEGKALLDKFLSNPEMQEGKVSWGSLVEENSSSFAMQDVVIENKSGEKINVKTVTVRGLKEVGGRISYDSIAVGDVNGDTKRGGKFALAGLASSQGDVPYKIFEDGLTPEEKKERIRFGNFTVSGLAVDNDGVRVTLDSISMLSADIPLDFRYEPAAKFEGEPAAPLTFDLFSMTGLSGSQQGVSWKMGAMLLKDANVPTSINATVAEWMKLYSAVSFNDISAKLGDLPVFALKSLSGTIAPPNGEGTAISASSMDGLYVNLKAIPDPKTQAIAQQLGYDSINASMTGNGSYNLTSGRMVISDFALMLKDMFNMNMAYVVTGYTQDVAQKILEAQFKSMEGGGSMSAFMAILPDLQNVKLEHLKFGLTDQSLTGKLLDFQAQQMGSTGDQLAAGAPMMLGLGMAGLKMPAFTEMVTTAVGTFLKTKGTLSLEAKPAEPVSIVNVVLAGQADPTKVPELLNLQVSAQ